MFFSFCASVCGAVRRDGGEEGGRLGGWVLGGVREREVGRWGRGGGGMKGGAVGRWIEDEG